MPTPNKVLLFDGAMGTMLQQRGLAPGEAPEIFGLRHPQRVTEIHRLYVNAGADIATTNTFGANALRFGDDTEAIVASAVAAARSSGAEQVALDIGPLGTLLEPLGTLSFEEAYRLFAGVVKAGQDADIILIETMSDLYECKAAVLAAKEHSRLPVYTTLSFGADGRSFLGTDVLAAVTALESWGADALGLNCSLGPEQAAAIAGEFLRLSRIPVLIQPNAGMPSTDGSAMYKLSPDEFAECMAGVAALGAQMLGGCCGTTPEHIAALRKTLDALPPVHMETPGRRSACTSGVKTTVFGQGAVLIGERLNPTGKKRLQSALREGDMAYIRRIAGEQAAAGADVLDVNVGLPDVDEAALLPAVVKEVQSVTELPLQLDSANPAALEAALRIARGKPIVNSVNGKQESLDAILPLCRRYGAMVVGLTLDENGIPPTAQGRLDIARRIVEAAERHGIPREDILIDCLTLTCSAQQKESYETLKAVALVKQELGVHTVLGVSNVSFGLPKRPLLGSVFLAGALGAGLDACIADPLSLRFREVLDSWRVLDGTDPGAATYIERYIDTDNATSPTNQGTAPNLAGCILQGRDSEALAAAKALLSGGQAVSDILDNHLIPALDEAGQLYDQGKLFLPQLMRAAGTAGAVSDHLRSQYAEDGGYRKQGRILLATVKGDVHDIGKNNVKMLLENYGFAVRDLGRDVPPEHICDEIAAGGYRLCGLSALMTTTVSAMEETIALAKQRGLDCRFMVGGAVLTADYAARIGADYYAKDAREGVLIAREVLG